MALRCFALGGRGSFMRSGSKCSCNFLLHCRNSSIQETTSSWSGGREKLPRLKSRPIFSARASMSNVICGIFTLKSRRGTFSVGIPSTNCLCRFLHDRREALSINKFDDRCLRVAPSHVSEQLVQGVAEALGT